MRWLIFIVLLAVLGCDVIHVEEDTDTYQLDTAQDAGDDVCSEACVNLAELGCDGAEGSPGVDEVYGTEDDVPCDVICRETIAAGVDMHPICVAAAPTCEAADECFN
jgi:hypothetical protein